ncbi:MAG: hypothetical protein ACKV2V_07140 [Blastocatellia bacterium]
MPTPITPRQWPAAAAINHIASLNDAALRNLRITQAYAELSRAFGAALPGAANWCTFATWASRQAGRTIRHVDMARTIVERLDTSELLDAGLRALARITGGQRGDLQNLLTRALGEFGPLRRTGDAVARGNLKVFAEIAPHFARFLDLFPPDTVPDIVPDTVIDVAALTRFQAELRAGDPPDGQDYLRRAFAAYAQARQTTEANARAQLLLLGNTLVGYHEQIRLQPEIKEAMEGAVLDPAELREALRRVFVTRLPLTGRLLEWLPFRRSPLDGPLDLLSRGLRDLARLALTEHLMSLALPGGEVLRLGRDLPRGFPTALQDIRNTDLTALLARVDPTPGSVSGSGALDWADFADRMHFIADLFRGYQEDARLFEAPFTDVQTALIQKGSLPAGLL